MPKSEVDILSVTRGCVEAPAGCGKTQLITDALKRHTGAKPILVLTHTNAGVVALRGRLQRAGVSPSTYRLSTIDGWAIRLASNFPERSKVSPEDLSSPNYTTVRDGAIRLLRDGHINDCISATYGALIVDEYQDCSQRQHSIIHHAAKTLSTCVLGDPLQAIFGFGSDTLCDWETKACLDFPKIAELDQPWRWINANTQDLGEWLLDMRRRLLRGKSIDLETAPEELNWVELDGSSQDHAKLISAARWTGKGASDGVLIIGDSRNPAGRHELARGVPGCTVIEPVDLGQMVRFFASFKLDRDSLSQVLSLAEEVMTGVERSQLMQRVEILKRGSAKKQASPTEEAAVAFSLKPSSHQAAGLLSSLGGLPETRVFRPTMWRSCIRAFEICAADSALSFSEAAIRVREQNRSFGRPLPRRAIGSTLLLKGLEAGVVVVLNADDLNPANLYVALTRGARRVTVCSQNSVLCRS
jgi:hypothetical protein